MPPKQAVNKPPKEWWDKMYDEVKKGNPEYSDEQVRKTVGDIWHHKLSPAKKQEETKKSEGSMHTQAQEKQIVLDFPEEIFRAIDDNSLLKTLVSQPGQLELNIAETEKVREGLLDLIQHVTNKTLGDQITDLLMEIDEKVFQGDPQNPPSGEAGEAVSDALDSLDEFFKESKTAAGFPNLFSNDTKKWIQLQTTNLAAKKGNPASPEQAQAYIDTATTQVAQELASAIDAEVRKVVEEFREKIFQDITTGMEFNLQTPRPMTPPAKPAEEGVTARTKAKMTAALAKAFDNSYAYDAVHFVLLAELGKDFVKLYAADELIDEEEDILSIAEQAFPKVPRNELSDAFGRVLTDVYSGQ